jgi:oligopeptide transport system substrate-binding protein
VIGAPFTGLVRYDPVTAGPHNAVARSIEATDPRVWTITLKDGWTFQDGTSVTAQSFVDAWNHTVYGPSKQVTAGFFREIEGFDRVNAAQPTAQELSGRRRPRGRAAAGGPSIPSPSTSHREEAA